MMQCGMRRVLSCCGNKLSAATEEAVNLQQKGLYIVAVLGSDRVRKDLVTSVNLSRALEVGTCVLLVGV